jgi:hypothetical protein
MELPEYAPVRFDRISTREELFEVLEMLGGFEEPEGTELPSKCDLLTCIGTDPTVSAAEMLDTATSNEERLLMEIEPFTALRSTKAERIN